ncbi:hypothetical protein DL93DRAFT_1324832 [Clavulina sp. PMI_390]|nr:hypothetical protein DL93DRAFT_1324832 [Clavulina sp. PMI_390]
MKMQHGARRYRESHSLMRWHRFPFFSLVLLCTFVDLGPLHSILVCAKSVCVESKVAGIRRRPKVRSIPSAPQDLVALSTITSTVIMGSSKRRFLGSSPLSGSDGGQ